MSTDMKMDAGQEGPPSPRLRQAGQTMSESILWLPFYLLLVFGMLQMGQLVAALLVSKYAASAIAREVVQDQTRDSALGGTYMTRYQKLMTAGMKKSSAVLQAEYTNDGLFSNVTVHACTQIDVFPFVGQFLKPVLGSRYAGSGCTSGGSAIGPFTFSGSPPYTFGVHGAASARMNYQPTS